MFKRELHGPVTEEDFLPHHAHALDMVNRQGENQRTFALDAKREMVSLDVEPGGCEIENVLDNFRHGEKREGSVKPEGLGVHERTAQLIKIRWSGSEKELCMGDLLVERRLGVVERPLPWPDLREIEIKRIA